MFVFEQKVLEEVPRASPRACHVLGGTFRCGFSWISATPGAHLESAACCLQLLWNSCFLPYEWNLAGGKRGQPEDGFALGSREADTLLSACGFTWGRVWLYLRHLNQTEPFSSSPNLPKDLCVLPPWDQGDYVAVSAGPRAKFWVPWPVIKW